MVGFSTAPEMMIVEDTSPLGYEETVQAIQDAAVAQGWKIPTVHEIDKSVAKAGYDLLPVSLIELCHPGHAVKVLQDDKARVVTSMMPCRVSVYETSDGRVVISRMNTGLVSKFFGGTVATVMAEATADTEEILGAAVRAAARDLVRRSGQMGVPVIDIGGKIIVGFDNPIINQLNQAGWS